MLEAEYEEYTFEFAAAESGVDADTIRAGGRDRRHRRHAGWPPTTGARAAAGNEGGWQVARTLFFLNALIGAIAGPGGTYPNAWNKFVARPIHLPRHPEKWNELNWPVEYPLTMYEMSFLLPHLLQARGAAGSTSTSPASTTRCGPTPTASPGSRCSPTRRRSACTWR